MKSLLIAFLVLGTWSARAHELGSADGEMLFPLEGPTEMWDTVTNGNMDLSMPQLEDVLLDTVDDMKGTFELYEPKIGDGVRVIEPLRVTGSKQNPLLHMKIEKCVGFFCQEADLDASVVAITARGACKMNWVIDIDIARSSRVIVDQYDRLQINTCFNATSTSDGKLALTGRVRRGPNYSRGPMQSAILDVLKSQFEPMTQALRKNMRRHTRQ